LNDEFKKEVLAHPDEVTPSSVLSHFRYLSNLYAEKEASLQKASEINEISKLARQALILDDLITRILDLPNPDIEVVDTIVDALKMSLPQEVAEIVSAHGSVKGIKRQSLDAAFFVIVKKELSAALDYFQLPEDTLLTTLRSKRPLTHKVFDWPFPKDKNTVRASRFGLFLVNKPGNAEAINALRDVFECFEATVWVMVGSAGGNKITKPPLKVRDVIVADQVFDASGGVHLEGGDKSKFTGYPIFGKVKNVLSKLTDRQKNELLTRELCMNSQVRCGPVISSEKFNERRVVQAEERETAVTEVKDSLAFDMESSGFMNTCNKLAINAFVVRGLSDVAPQSDDEYDANQKEATMNAVSVAVSIVNRLRELDS
jgi:nucleoside phosphorylase